MARESFSFRRALDELKYLQSIEGAAESFFQKIVSNMKKYKIPVECVDQIYICLKMYSFGKITYRIHVSYDQKGGDFKQRIHDVEGLDFDEAMAIMKRIQDYLNKEGFKVTDSTKQSVGKDSDIKMLIKMKLDV